MARRTKAEALATRDRILDAAERVFHERGVAHTTLQDIAEAAGVTRGAIYWHFADKPAVFGAMFERAFLPVEGASALSKPLDGESPLDTLRRHVDDLLQRMVDDDALRRVVGIVMHKVEIAGDLLVVRERVLQARARHVDLIQRRLAGTGLDLPTRRALAVGLHALVDGLLENWVLAPASFDLVACGRRAFEAYLAGVASLAAPRPATPPSRAGSARRAAARTGTTARTRVAS
jgi:TetR/AcrR family acrAB operon transcriptional repressor